LTYGRLPTWFPKAAGYVALGLKYYWGFFYVEKPGQLADLVEKYAQVKLRLSFASNIFELPYVEGILSAFFYQELEIRICEVGKQYALEHYGLSGNGYLLFELPVVLDC